MEIDVARSPLRTYSKDDLDLHTSMERKEKVSSIREHSDLEFPNDPQDGSSVPLTERADPLTEDELLKEEIVKLNLPSEISKSEIVIPEYVGLKEMIIPEKAVIRTKDEETNEEIVSFDKSALELIQPIVVFINPKSGGQQGKKLFQKFNELLNPAQVFDLSKGGPGPGLEQFRSVKNIKILVCGGDGTAGWVLMTIDKLKIVPAPHVAVLPLGTGNDLARALKWGGGYEGGKILPLVEALGYARSVLLDRWSLKVQEKEKEGTYGNVSEKSVMNNYFSVGIDAQVALGFHKQREAHPEKFKSRFGNKVSYTAIGTKAAFGDKKLMHNALVLEVDGKIVSIPHDAEGLVVLNLNSYMGGTNLWGNRKDAVFSEQKINDALLEVVAVNSSFQLGAIKIGLSSAKRVAQGKSLKFTIQTPTCVQVDGEPWLQPESVVFIDHLNQSSMLVKSPKPMIPRLKSSRACF